MAPGLQAVHSHYSLGDNDVKTTFKFGLNDDVKVKIGHSKKTNALVGEVHGDDWEAKYNFSTQDFKYEFKRETPAGKLKVHQDIPGGKWQLLPSPHVQLTTSLLKKAEDGNEAPSKDRFKIGYCFQKSVADFEGAVWLDSRIKLKAEGNTNTELDGAVLAATIKPDIKGISKLGIKYSKDSGAALGATLKGLDGQVKVKASAHLQKKQLDAHFKLKHSGWEQSELHLEAQMPFGGKPTIVNVGIHYDV